MGFWDESDGDGFVLFCEGCGDESETVETRNGIFAQGWAVLDDAILCSSCADDVSDFFGLGDE